MEDISINVLVDAKNEYMMQLTNILTPHLYTGTLSKIYNKAVKQCTDDEDITPVFKQLLKDVPKWNQDVIADVTKYVVEKSQCDWLDNLLTAVFISNARILTAVRTQTPKDKRLNLTIPTTEHFVHHCYVEVAREMYKNPYLFDTEDMTNGERHRNLRDTLDLIKECVGQAVRKLLPVQHILKQYLGHLHDDDDISVVSEKEGENSPPKFPDEFKKGRTDLSDVEEGSDEDQSSDDDQNTDTDTDQNTDTDVSDSGSDSDSDKDDDIDLVTVDDVDQELGTDTDTDLSSDFDVDSVLTEESGDEFSDLEIEKPTRVENKPMEYKDVVVDSEKTDTEKVLASSDPVVLKSNSPVVLKSNSPVVNLGDVTVSKEDEPVTLPFGSSVPVPAAVSAPTPEIPVPPLSRSIGLKTMASPVITPEPKEETTVETPKEPEIKIITDGKTPVEEPKPVTPVVATPSSSVEEPKPVTPVVTTPSTPTPVTPTLTPTPSTPSKPLLKIPEPHTPVNSAPKESREERRRRKKEKRIRELRERGIIVRKPIRKAVKDRMRKLKREENRSKPKVFQDRPSTPPSPSTVANPTQNVGEPKIPLETRPVFFNDAETRLSDFSDDE